MSSYRVIRIIGTSPTSWEDAAKTAVEEAARHLEDLRVAEVELLDMRMENNKVAEYRDFHDVGMVKRLATRALAHK